MRLQVECCVCHKVHGDTGWVSKSGDEFAGRVSHGYCPSCYRNALEELERDFSVMRMQQPMFTEA